jgi:hypothetical protein
MKTINIGERVIYVDPIGVEHDALITANWGAKEYDETKTLTTAINVVYVSGDEKRTDQYGRQTLHETSVTHQSSTSAHGRYWYQK